MIALLLLSSAASFAPPPCPEKGQAGEERCAAAELTKAEKRLSMAWNKAVQTLRDPARRNTTKAFGQTPINLLTVEQKSWRAWRDAHCNVMAYSMEGTSGEAMVRYDCKTGMTLDRVKILEGVGAS